MECYSNQEIWDFIHWGFWAEEEIAEASAFSFQYHSREIRWFSFTSTQLSGQSDGKGTRLTQGAPVLTLVLPSGPPMYFVGSRAKKMRGLLFKNY